jgi:hypothetical protein
VPAAWFPSRSRDARLAGGFRSPQGPHTGPGGVRLRRGPVVVLVDPRQGVMARNASLRERVTVRMHQDRLDRALAAGTCPENTAELALRAANLVSTPTRRQIARSLTRLLNQAAAPPPRLPAPQPLAQLPRVTAARHELETLRNRVLLPGPVNVRGMALVHNLLTDGSGPLFRLRSQEDLADLAIRAAHALESDSSQSHP